MIFLYLPAKKKAFALVFLGEKTNNFSLKGQRVIQSFPLEQKEKEKIIFPLP